MNHGVGYNRKIFEMYFAKTQLEPRNKLINKQEVQYSSVDTLLAADSKSRFSLRNEFKTDYYTKNRFLPRQMSFGANPFKNDDNASKTPLESVNKSKVDLSDNIYRVPDGVSMEDIFSYYPDTPLNRELELFYTGKTPKKLHKESKKKKSLDTDKNELLQEPKTKKNSSLAKYALWGTLAVGGTGGALYLNDVYKGRAEQEALSAKIDEIQSLSAVDEPKSFEDDIKTYSSTRDPKLGPGALKGDTIIVNPGHGWWSNNKTLDPGAPGKGADGEDLDEYMLNRKFTAQMVKLLTDQDATVIYIGGYFPHLEAKIKALKADALISVHTNDQSKQIEDPNAADIYYGKGFPKGKDFADTMRNTIRSVKPNTRVLTDDKSQHSRLGVLRTNKDMAAVLIETGKPSIYQDPAYLDFWPRQWLMMEGAVHGLVNYLHHDKEQMYVAETAAIKEMVEKQSATYFVSTQDFERAEKGKKGKNTSTSDLSHTYKEGETVESIEKAYALRPGELAFMNNISEADTIVPGRELMIGKARINPAIISSKEDIMKVFGYSREFLDKVILLEGKKDAVYEDQKLNQTIGIGHFLSPFEKIYYKDKVISEAEIYRIFAQDLFEKETYLKDNLGTGSYASLKTNKKEVLIDVVFNRGHLSQNLISAIKSGNRESIAENLIHPVLEKDRQNTSLMYAVSRRWMYWMGDYFKGEKHSDAMINTAQRRYDFWNKAAHAMGYGKHIISKDNEKTKAFFNGRVKLRDPLEKLSGAKNAMIEAAIKAVTVPVEPEDEENETELESADEKIIPELPEEK